MTRDHFIIQCARCKFIVADSAQSYSYNQEFRTVLLDSSELSSRIKVTEGTTQSLAPLKTKLDGETAMYKVTTCIECNKIIGKLYYEVPEKYHYLKSKVMLSKDEILCYVLGRGQIVIDSLFNSNNMISNDYCLNGDDETIPTFRSEDDQIQPTISYTTIDSVNQEIDKIQLVLISVVQRLSALENSQTRSEKSHESSEINSAEHLSDVDIITKKQKK